MNINIFAQRLRECRLNLGLNVRELGELVGISGANVSRYENAIHGPSSDVLQAMITLFNVNPAWLMGASNAKYIHDSKDCKRIPVLGYIAAGQPIIAEENIIDYEYVEETSHIDFCLIVKGDSMINARILDGDLVYVRKQSLVENGEIAVVLIDNEEATLKRFYKLDGSVLLRAENPNYPDRILTKKDVKSVQVLGKAVILKSEVR